MNAFYDLQLLELGDIEDLLHQAGALETTAEPHVLEGKVLAMLFLNPSLRTLSSFQATMIRLGGGSFVISPEMSIHGLETRQGIVMDGSAAEHIREAVPVIASYADVIGIRASAKCENLQADLADLEYNELRSYCNIPVINLESAIHHPCQSLGDWKTLNDLEIPQKSGKMVFSWVYHPDALPLSVMADSLRMSVRRGMDVTLLRPDGFGLPDELANDLTSIANMSGGSIRESNERDVALEGAHILYANSWSSTDVYGDRLADKKLRDQHEDWCVDKSWFETADQNCHLMHCLPVRRGIEVDDEVMDSDLSAVTLQARNRMYTQMAVIRQMLTGR